MWTDWSYTDFDTPIFTSAETLDNSLFGIGRNRDEIVECYVFEEFVGYAAFVGMANLEKVYFDSQVTSFTSELFRQDPKLEEVYFAGRTTYQVEHLPYYSWGIEDTSIIKAEFPPEKTYAVYANGEKVDLDVVGEFTSTSIPLAGLETIEIGSNVTSIGVSAFENCTSLRSVVVNEGVQTVGLKGFARCPQLASIVLPSTIEDIGPGAFVYCGELNNVTLVGRTMDEVYEMDNFSWGLLPGCVIHCSDGDIEI